MAEAIYDQEAAALLVIDPYNHFISESELCHAIVTTKEVVEALSFPIRLTRSAPNARAGSNARSIAE